MEYDRIRYRRFVQEIFDGESGRWGDDDVLIRVGSPDSVVRMGGTLLALVSTDADDVFHVVGRFAVRQDAPALVDQILSAGDVEREPNPYGNPAEPIDFGTDEGCAENEAADWAVTDDERAAQAIAAVDYVHLRSTRQGPLAQVRHVLDLLRDYGPSVTSPSQGDGMPPVYPAIVAVHGLLSAQIFKPGEPYEPSDMVPPPPLSLANGRDVHVLDSGLAAKRVWNTQRICKLPTDGDDRLVKPSGVLDFAGGHGTFVAGVCHQADPGARVRVHLVGGTSGLVDETTVVTRLALLARSTPKPDVVVMGFGGYANNVTGPGANPQNRWGDMAVLRGAVARFLKDCPSCVIVAAAGNEQSTDPCYPAAFSTQFPDRVISAGANVIGRTKAWFSNSGPWVNAYALGFGIRSMFVAGAEDPVVDTPPDTFVGYAAGAGTSFAAPLIAGIVTRCSVNTTARQAWLGFAAASGGRAVQFGDGGVVHL